MPDDVKSLLLEIDASVELLRRNIKRGEDYVDGFAKNVDRRLDGVDRRFDQAGRGIGSIGKTLDTVRGKMDSYGASLKAVATGFIAAQGVDILVRLVKGGLDYASALQEQADQLGVTTDALQEYRYAATQTGVAESELDQAFTQLTRRLGEAAEGAKGPAAAFEKLGISLRDSNGEIRRTEDVIPLVAASLEKIESPAQRAAILVDLFGKAGQRLEPLLKGGVKELNNLRNGAYETGQVLSSEQIQKADQTADKLGQLSRALSVKIAGSVADNTDSIVELADALVKLVGVLGTFVTKFREYREVFGATGNIAVGAALGGTPLGAQFTASGLKRLEVADRSKRASALRGRFADIDVTSLKKTSNFASSGLDSILRPNDDSFRAIAASGGTVPGTGKGLPDIKAFSAVVDIFSKPSKVAAAKLNEFSIELDRMNADLALARADISGSLTDRAAAEKARVAADLAADRLRIQAEKELTDAQKQKSIAVQEQIAAARVELIEQELAKDIAEQKREADQQLLDQKLEKLDDERRTLEVEADATVSRRERVEIERRILAIQQEEERARLEAAIAAGQIADAAQARANLEQRQSTERGQLEKGGAGPVGQYLEGLRVQAANLNDELENVAVGGLQSLNDGLADAIVSGDNLGKVFDRVLDQILSDLIRIALQQATLSIFGGGGGGLGSSLGGGLAGLGGGGGGGGFFGAIGKALGQVFNKPIGAKALGGPVSKGRSYLVGEQGEEVFIPNVDGQIVSNSKLRNMSGGGGGVMLTINAPGATAETVAMIRRELANAAPQIAAAARNATVAEISRQRLP